MAKRRGNGEGSITQRKDGRWQGCITIGMDPKTGKPKKQYFYGKKRKEVQDKITEALGDIRKGTFAEPTKLTVGEWLETWLNNYMKPSLRPTTWASYETQVNKHLKPAFEHVKLQSLQTRQLQNLYNKKLEGNRADKKEGGLSPRSVRYIHTVIRAALDQAVKEKIITINPANAAKLPKMEQKEVQSLDTEGVTLFLQEAAKTKHYAAYLLDIATGLRRGELLALKWEDITLRTQKGEMITAGNNFKWKDINMETAVITVNRNLVRTKEGLTFQRPKNNKTRTVNIPGNVLNELKTHNKKQSAKKLELGKAYKDEGLVFCLDDGSRMDPRGFARHFERMIERLQKKGFTRITFHGLRHSFATLSLQEGVDIKTIQDALGHHNPAFTMKVYSHVTEKMKKEATSKIGNLLASCTK